MRRPILPRRLRHRLSRLGGKLIRAGLHRLAKSGDNEGNGTPSSATVYHGMYEGLLSYRNEASIKLVVMKSKAK